MQTRTISPGNSRNDPNPARAVGLPVQDGIYSVLALRPYRELLHGISTRLAPGGTDWNLSAKRGTPANPPDPAVALFNRARFAQGLGISLDRIVGCQQVHGTEVAIVDDEDAGKGMLPELPSIQGCDAMVTATPNLYLLALSADCPPVFFYDPAHRAIGLAHSGWKGTVGRISASVVAAMGRHFGSRPEDIVAVVGPGIGPCCYKVGPNVVEAVETAFSRPWSLHSQLLDIYDGEVYFNLWEGIRRALLDAGVPPRNVAIDGLCTMHNTGTFYSHRGEAGKCGLFGAVLGLRAE